MEIIQQKPLRRNPRRNRITMNLKLPDFVSNIDEMIANAPDGEPETDKPAKPNLVREVNGWGLRYIADFSPLGDDWATTYAEASKAVSQGGLVAFLGNRGTGKTQMAAEIAKSGEWTRDKGEWNGNTMVAGKTAIYRRAMDIFLDLRDRSPGHSEKTVLEKLTYCGLLVIDEFQERGETPFEDRIITNLLDKRYNDERPTILIANLDREGLKNMLSPSVIDRMRQNGRSFLFNGKSYRTKP
jgi:DNA replication protein DnaC